jgi:tetratricopeptide (TPR) repeat protein
VRTVLEGSIGRLGKGYSLVLKIVDADDARVVLSASDAAADERALIPTVDRIAKRLRAELGERRSAIQATRGLQRVRTPSFEAYRSWLRGQTLLWGGENRAAITWCRRALELDPDMATAWAEMGFCYGNLDQPDSALAFFRQALARPERLSEEGRLLVGAQVAVLSGDLAGALAAQEQAVQLMPQVQGALCNLSALLIWAGRFREGLESAREAERVSPFGPTQPALANHLWSLLMLGQVDEARLLVPKLRGNLALEAPMDIAAAAGQWAAAESLATVLRGAADADEDLRRAAATILAAVQASRGQVEAADQTLRQAQSVAETTQEWTRVNWTRWDRLRLALFSYGVAADPGFPGTWDSTTTGLVVRGAWAAATGDTTLARRLPATIRKRSEIDLARQGFFGPEMVEAWLAARTGRWNEVLRLLGPAALQGEARGYALVQSAPLVRWLVAEAHERLDRPDSAAAYFERAIAPVPEGGTDFAQVRMASSFGHRRLALLYARMGRQEEARRHWEIFSAAFTHPDPETKPLLEEARAALASAEGLARTARR